MKKPEHTRVRSVVYSFQGRWEEALQKGYVRVFFRKRRPIVMPERVYLYVGVPVKKIIGFCTIKKIEAVDLKSATELREAGAITENELLKYIGDKRTVHAIHVSAPTIFQSPLPLVELEDEFNFSPPQSFSNVKGEFEKFLLGKIE